MFNEAIVLIWKSEVLPSKWNDLEINFKQTAFQVTNYINAFSFRPYQLLKYKDFRIAKSFITEKSSTLKPGTILDETESFFLLSTIDYDVCILKDRLESILVSAEQNDFKRLDDYLNCGYDLTEKNMFGWDPLIVASYYGSFDTINYILQNRLINVNTKNNNGTTALMYAMTYAVKTNDLIAMKLLIDIGASLSQTDYNGLDVFSYAEKYKNKKVINFLNQFWIF